MLDEARHRRLGDMGQTGQFLRGIARHFTGEVAQEIAEPLFRRRQPGQAAAHAAKERLVFVLHGWGFAA
jgi:hypothetical protein